MCHKVFDLLWRLICHDIWFVWERAEYLQQLDEDVLCQVPFKVCNSHVGYTTPIIKYIATQQNLPYPIDVLKVDLAYLWDKTTFKT